VHRVPPHNLAAERSVLGAVFIKPAAFDEVASTLQVDDFFLPAHREIFEAMLALCKRRQAIDPIAVADELQTRGMLQRLEGGAVYLTELHNGTPTGENAGHYARLVKEKATLRRLIAVCAEVQSSAYGDFGEFDTFLDDAESKVAEVARSGAPPAPSLAGLVDRLAVKHDRLATGLRTLDEGHRGGFEVGRLVMFGGAPGAGKTSLAIALATLWARNGVRVSVLASDEPAQGLLIRVGQILGIEREDLEAASPEALEQLRRELLSLPTLTIIDADDDRATVEAAAAVLRDGGPAVLIVDSLQTARAAGSAEAESPRARVDAVIAALKSIARRGVLVIATCELARGAYRSRDAAERTDDLAAGKESGAIEYAAGTLLVLRSVADEVGLIDVTIPKNRGGDRTPFRLAMNFARATLHETEMPDRPDGQRSADPETLLETDITAAREALRRNPGLAGYDRLRAAMGQMSTSRKSAAIRALEAAGEIENKGTRRRPRLFLQGGE
jgi:replicative DNA helicase